MGRKKLILIGMVLLVLGAYANGIFERIWTGDTFYYIKTIGGYAGTAAGFLILEHAIIRKGGDDS